MRAKMKEKNSAMRPVPAVPALGFMLDVSRGRVPTMPSLFRLADRLHLLGFTQLQLYVEHTFAFPRHAEVWRGASPLTAEEIRALDAHCRSRGIELVPNLNSFGHVERWLKHKKYRHLAECPDGFYHALFKMHRPAGTFFPCEETADFMGALYREYLPHFSSDKFNIGGDEPWELGIGRSRERCAALGKRAVYVEHMLRLKKRAAACGRKIMFWADVLLDDGDGNGDDGNNDGNGDSVPARGGEIPAELLDGAVPVIWGYEATHPFDAQCARVRAALEKVGGNGTFMVAPGTSAWLSFGTRLTNALANIRAAFSAAKKWRAGGVLLTTWGDFGYHNPPAANLLPLIFCAALVHGDPVPETPADFVPALEKMGVPAADVLAEALFAFGKLDDFIAKKIPNRSWIREVFFAKGEAFEKLVAGVPAAEIAAAQAENACVLKLLEGVPASCAEAAELSVAAEMTSAALRRAAAFLRGDAPARAAAEAEAAGTLREKFAAAWRLSCREGGLEESLSFF